MTRFKERLLIGVVSFALGSALAFQVVDGQETNPLDGNLTHLGLVVRDIETSAKVFGDVFGVAVPPAMLNSGVPVPPGRGDAVDVKRTNLTKNNFTIELIEPVGGPSPWQQYLDEHGEGVHHLGFAVSDVPAAVAFLEARGGQWVLGTEAADFGYVDLAPQLGLTIEVLGPSLGP